MILTLPDNIDKLKYLTGDYVVKKFVKSRSNLQNKALHLFFTWIAERLNDLGMEFHYDGIQGFEITTTYTMDIVKNFIWRPIMMAMFQIESTTKVNTNQINAILDVLIKYFGDRGISIAFPNKFDKWLAELEKSGQHHSMFNQPKYNRT